MSSNIWPIKCNKSPIKLFVFNSFVCLFFCLFERRIILPLITVARIRITNPQLKLFEFMFLLSSYYLKIRNEDANLVVPFCVSWLVIFRLFWKKIEENRQNLKKIKSIYSKIRKKKSVIISKKKPRCDFEIARNLIEFFKVKFRSSHWCSVKYQILNIFCSM